MIITPNTNSSTKLLFISDKYRVIKVQGAIRENCSDLTISDPILFNSTNNLPLGTVVQFFRGDNITAVPWGNDSAKVTSPPPSIDTSTWECLNYTIGESMLFGNAASSITSSTTVLLGPRVFLISFFFFFLWRSSFNSRRLVSRSTQSLCEEIPASSPSFG